MKTSPTKYATALAAALVLALGLYGCGGGGTDGGGTTMPQPKDVDLLSNVTPGFTAGSGTVTVAAGQSVVHGDIEFNCAAGGPDCEVTVTVANDGTITATSTGGTVTARNADTYDLRISVANQANAIHAATGIDRVRGTDPLSTKLVTSYFSGSEYLGVSQTDGAEARYATAIPWVNSLGAVNFSIALGGFTGAELHPLGWLGRSIYTSDISTEPAGIETTYSEVTGHGLGSNWRTFEVGKGICRPWHVDNQCRYRCALILDHAGRDLGRLWGLCKDDRTERCSRASRGSGLARPERRRWRAGYAGRCAGSIFLCCGYLRMLP